MPIKRNKDDHSKSLGKHWFPHEEDYVCDVSEVLFSPGHFSDLKCCVIANNVMVTVWHML